MLCATILLHLCIYKYEYIAYSGRFYDIEWFFDSSGYSQSYEYVMKLSPKFQQKLFYLFKRIADDGKISDKTKFVYEGDKIYAFKPQPYRFLAFFIRGKKIIVTNAFRKQTNKIPRQEKELSLKCYKDYLKRIENGKYYEEQ